MGGRQGVSAPQELYRFLLRATSPQAQALLFVFESLELQFEHKAPGEESPWHLFTLWADGVDERDRLRDTLQNLPHSQLDEELYPYDRFAWVEKWKEAFFWSQLSARLAVGPDFRPCPFHVPHTIAMTPGQAFGTGVHETTRIALRLLDTYLEPGMSVCDAGTGTGILAIAARKLGSGRTVGFDINPDSHDETGHNSAANGVQFDFLFGSGYDVEGTFDVVVANMLAHELVPLADMLRRLVRPGGLILLTGLIKDNFDTFEYRFFDLPQPAAPDGWKSPTLQQTETEFVALEKRWENEWWGGAWRRRS